MQVEVKVQCPLHLQGVGQSSSPKLDVEHQYQSVQSHQWQAENAQQQQHEQVKHSEQLQAHNNSEQVSPIVIQSPPEPNTIQMCLQLSLQLIDSIPKAYYEHQLNLVYQQLLRHHAVILSQAQPEQSIMQYTQIVIKYSHEEMFFQHFIECNFLQLLLVTLRHHRYADWAVRAVFGCLEYLLKGLRGREEQFIYLLTRINKVGLLQQQYKFSEKDDWAYFVHFLKGLIRVINMADASASKQQQLQQYTNEQLHSKYLSIFFNSEHPEFPLALRLLGFHNWPDSLIRTSVKLCLLELSAHPSRHLQKYLANFPFVTLYILYCTRTAEHITQYLGAQAALRRYGDKPDERDEYLLEEVMSDMKFMEDLLKSIETSAQQYVQQHMNFYINTFMYYVGKTIYQELLKNSSSDSNTSGHAIVRCLLLIIKLLRMNSIVKIKLGLQELLHKYINCSYEQYLRAKIDEMDDKYLIFQVCRDNVREHASQILYRHQGNKQAEIIAPVVEVEQPAEQPKMSRLSVLASKVASFKLTGSPSAKPNKKPPPSFLNTMKSYIPTTNENWLYYELRKLSQVLGLHVSLNTELEQYSALSAESTPYYKDSFLAIIDSIQYNQVRGNDQLISDSKKSLFSKASSPIRPNPIFAGIVDRVSRPPVKNNKKHSAQNQPVADIDGEQLLYYYLILMCSLADSTKIDRANQYDSVSFEELHQLLKIISACRSLMLVGIMYWYIKLLDYQIDNSEKYVSAVEEALLSRGRLNMPRELQQSDNRNEQNLCQEVLGLYLATKDKLVYFVLTQGWQSFTKHISSAKKIIWNSQQVHQNSEFNFSYQDPHLNPLSQFSNDIFRDIQCDIVYFVMLRHIFGTRNTPSECTTGGDAELGSKDNICREIRVPCRLTNQHGDKVMLIMDGQYVKFMNSEDVIINKRPLSISEFNIFEVEEQSKTSEVPQRLPESVEGIQVQIEQKRVEKPQRKDYIFELVDKNMNGECFTVYFQELPIRSYVGRELKWRKKTAANIEMELRTMRFDIET